MVHKQIRDYPCDFCKIAFSNGGHLKRHVQEVHEKKKEFKCDICTKLFPAKRTLKTHIKTLHKDFIR